MTVTKDLLAGLLFLLIGLGTVVEAQDYAMGSVLRMGPGFFPTMIGTLTALVGAALVGRSILRQGEAPPRFAFRPLLFLLCGIVVFAVTLERAGLVIATVLLIVISRLAARPVHWIGTLALSAALVAIAVVIFWYFLHLPLPLWP